MCQITFHSAMCEISSFFTPSSTLDAVGLLSFSHSSGWVLLMVSLIKHLFMSSFAFLPHKVSIQNFFSFLFELLVLLLSCKRSLYILVEIFCYLFCKYLPPICCWPFLLLNGVFWRAILLNFCGVQVLHFSITVCAPLPI